MSRPSTPTLLPPRRHLTTLGCQVTERVRVERWWRAGEQAPHSNVWHDLTLECPTPYIAADDRPLSIQESA